MDFFRSTRTDVPVTVAGDSLRAAVWTHSPAPAGLGKRPVLLIHGFRGDHHGMDLIAHYLRDRPVIVPDLPGFGATPAPAPGLGLGGFTQFVEAVQTSVAADYGVAPLVVGHSFGSIIVAHWAARRAAGKKAPDGIVLINPITTPALSGPSAVGTRATDVYYRLARALPNGAAHRLLSSRLIVRAMSEVMATTRDPGLRRYIHDQHARYFSAFADPRSLSEAFTTSVSHTVTEVTDELTMPVGVIAGARDLIAPIGPTRDFTAALAHGCLTEVEGVGHLIHYEAPEAAASFVSAFARGL